MKAADVITGKERWSVEAADCLDWLRALPDDSLDLLFTSPPYLEARTYGIGAGRKLDDWVRWMTEVVTAAAPKVKGLIAINCEGQTRNYRYLPSPFLLMAELHKAGFNLRKPVVFHRIGIPGSGGPDWLRNDWEPIVCVTRSGKLPWSDPTACGHPPVYRPGGAMSHRTKDGERVSPWYRGPKGYGARRPNGKRRSEERPPSSAKKGTATKGHAGGDTTTGVYTPPELANPGNVVQQTYTAEEVAALLDVPADVIDCQVGGGQMGSPIAHRNEAPFPLSLCEFFVLSFCSPGGVVADPFSGSGTVCHAAVMHGRRFVGADIRQSQVDLAARRMSGVTPGLFNAEG